MEVWNYLYQLNLVLRQMYQSSTSHSYPCDQDMCALSAGNINWKRILYIQFAPTSFSGNNQQPPLRQKAFPEDQQSAGVHWLLLRPSTSPGPLLIPRGEKKKNLAPRLLFCPCFIAQEWEPGGVLMDAQKCCLVSLHIHSPSASPSPTQPCAALQTPTLVFCR